MIRRLLFLVALAGAAWWLLSRRDGDREPGVVIGYADGSAVTLAAPERERMLAIARDVLRP